LKPRSFSLIGHALLLLLLLPERAAANPLGNSAHSAPRIEFQTGYSRSWLSGGREEWNAFLAEVLVHLEPQQERVSGRKLLSAKYCETQRFGLWDRDFGLGLSYPIRREWQGRIETSSSPSYHYLPRWQVLTGLSRTLGDDYVGHLDYRHTEHRMDAVEQISAGGDKYFSSFRAAYNFSWSAIAGETSAVGHRIVLEHYLDADARNRIAIALGTGHELENLGQDLIAKTRVHALWLYGRQPLTNRVSLAWQISMGEHSSYVQREVGIALRSSL